jgi:hypothetical protein
MDNLMEEQSYKDEACQMILEDNLVLYFDGFTMNLANVFPVHDYVLIALDKNPETMANSSGVVIANQVMEDNLPCGNSCQSRRGAHGNQ